MTPDDAAKAIQELYLKMGTEADKSEIAGKIYAAKMLEYQVHTATQDKGQMDACRQAIHASVDVILDAGHVLEEMKRQVLELTRNYQNM